MEDTKKYNYMEAVITRVNQKSVALKEEERKLNNKILKKVIDDYVIPKLKRQDPLFDKLFNKIFYGGSYYDGLKIGNPGEFDLDALMILPKKLTVQLENSGKPGFVHLTVKNFDEFKKTDEYSKYPRLERLLCRNDSKHFSTDQVKAWFESVLTNALQDERQMIAVPHNKEHIHVSVKVSKSGPAFTLKLNSYHEGKNISMDVDLVPCFVFTEDKWPTGYKGNPCKGSKDTFFVVPKKGQDEKYWRLSFQEQERVLISGKDYKTLKPALKLIKLLRDQQKHVGIASYYIKTVFLWEVKKNTDLWSKTPLSYTFMKMLNRYEQYLRDGKIPYYWNEKYNLLEHIQNVTLEGFANKIKNIISDIDRNPTDPFVFAKYLMSQSDTDDLKSEVYLGKKHLKNQRIAKCLSDATTCPRNPLKDVSIFDSKNQDHVRVLLSDPDFLEMAKRFIAEKVPHIFATQNSSNEKITPSEISLVNTVDDLLCLSDSENTMDHLSENENTTDCLLDCENTIDLKNLTTTDGPFAVDEDILAGENEKLLCKSNLSKLDMQKSLKKLTELNESVLETNKSDIQKVLEKVDLLDIKLHKLTSSVDKLQQTVEKSLINNGIFKINTPNIIDNTFNTLNMSTNCGGSPVSKNINSVEKLSSSDTFHNLFSNLSFGSSKDVKN